MPDFRKSNRNGALLLFRGVNPTMTATLPRKMGAPERIFCSGALCASQFDGRRPPAQRIGFLLFVEEREVRLVTSLFHLFDRNEMKSGGVNDVTLACGRFGVGKNMPKMSVASLGVHLGPLHVVRGVEALGKEIF